MCIDAIDSADDSFDLFSAEDLSSTSHPLWNGRHTQRISEKDFISQFYRDVQTRSNETLRDQMRNRDFTLLPCGNIVSDKVKDLVKSAKKAIERVKKRATEIADFIREHKKKF